MMTEEKRIPLAQRMRPKTFDDFVGQEHIAKKGSFFRRAIEAGTLGSAIFFGPPGTGKSTLANIIANQNNGIFNYTVISYKYLFKQDRVLHLSVDNTSTGNQAVFHC